MSKSEAPWHATACNLCYANCGVLTQLSEDGRSIARVKADKDHPVSQGYLCNKAQRLDYYQNGRDRLTSPLRRRDDGSFEEIDWDTAIREIAQRLSAVRDEHGGDKIMYYGGGGQGNHLGGGYNGSVAQALGIKFKSNALAQEKTGLAWMSERVLGGNWHGDFESADVIFIIGKNPWQSNGLQRARILMKELSKDEDKLLVVLDPRRTETADLADVHMAVKPGTDVWALSAILGTLVQKNLVNEAWLKEHAEGYQYVLDLLAKVPVADYAAFAGIPLEDVERVADAMGGTTRIAVYEDLGIEMSPYSTLCSYLNILMFLLRGSFANEGGTHLITGLASIFSYGATSGVVNQAGYEEDYQVSPVTGSRIVCGLVPCNSIPEEIDTDHPDRFRAMIVESCNPVHSLANSERFRQAFRKLDTLVVIDVAMTETAREADYVLPASTQYEKYEATFFNFEYPENFFHLRRPLMAPLPGTLPEPEIHARLVEALGVFEEGELDGLKEAASQGLDAFAAKVFAEIGANPKMMRFGPYVLYRTLGPHLPNGAASAAAVWMLCQTFAMANARAVQAAGHEGEGPALGNALFQAILDTPSGVIISREDEQDRSNQWRKDGGRVHMRVSEMLDELAGLGEYDLPERTDAFPFLLAAGERRLYTANTIIRDPQWMERSKNASALSMHPEDGAELGIEDLGRARVTTKAGSAEVVVEFSDRMQRGTLSLPNGLGLDYPDAQGVIRPTGVSPNELTSLEDRDKWVGTPWHKHVRARVEAVA